MNELDQLTVGDLLTHGTLLWEDTPSKTVWLMRDGDKMYMHTEWKNIRGMLDDNANAAAAFNATGKLDELVRVASIPIGVHYQWSKEGITEDETAIARRLNDGDYKKFRTNNLRV